MAGVELVRRAAGGDLAAFESLFLQYRDHAFAVAASILGSTAEATDVVQDAFLVALEELPQLRDEASFASWLTTIVRRKALRTRRHRTEPLDREVLDELPSLWQRRSSLDTAVSREARSLVREAIADLPERLSRVVNLRYRSDLSYDEIAQALCVPVSTIRARLHAARRRLKTRLESLAGIEIEGELEMETVKASYLPPRIRVLKAEETDREVALVEDPRHFLALQAGAASELAWFRYWRRDSGEPLQLTVLRRVVGPAVVEEEDCWEILCTLCYPNGHPDEQSSEFVAKTDEGFFPYVRLWQEKGTPHVRTLIREDSTSEPVWPSRVSVGFSFKSFGRRKSAERWTNVRINQHSFRCLEVLEELSDDPGQARHDRTYVTEEGRVALRLRYNTRREWQVSPEVAPLDVSHDGRRQSVEWSLVPVQYLRCPTN